MADNEFSDHPEWLVDWDLGDIVHYHRPRFIARIDDCCEHGGEHYKLPCGTYLTNIEWTDPRPKQAELRRLLSSAQNAIDDHLFEVVQIPEFRAH